MLTDEQREEALKLVEAFKNATQSLKPAETDLAIIYNALLKKAPVVES